VHSDEGTIEREYWLKRRSDIEEERVAEEHTAGRQTRTAEEAAARLRRTAEVRSIDDGGEQWTVEASVLVCVCVCGSPNKVRGSEHWRDARTVAQHSEGEVFCELHVEGHSKRRLAGFSRDGRSSRATKNKDFDTERAVSYHLSI
jgi:hypothetical protein